MMIIIEGINRTEFCEPKVRDIDRRRFYESRGQLYRVYPEQLTRMRFYEYGKEVGTDAVIVYQENCIHPQLEKGVRISYDKLLADIDEHKIMTGNGVSKRAWGILSGKHGISLWNVGVLVLFGAVLGWAFLANGGSI